MNREIALETKLAGLVTGRELVSRLFTQLGMDYCCQGSRSLTEACSSAGLDASTMLRVLRALDALPAKAEGEEPAPDLTALSLSALCDHIERKYHGWLRDELPRMDGLLELLDEKHSAQWPWIGPLRQRFEQVERDLDRHLRHEEQSVFPAVRDLESKGSIGTHSILLEFELQQLESEHAHSGADLQALRELAQDFLEPEGACSSTRRLFADLREFERQMHEHVHAENYVLFSRVRALLMDAKQTGLV